MEIIQEGLRLVRRELTSALAWVLAQKYGEAWWQRGVIEPLAQTGQRVDELPREGNAGDIDLYLSLKLVQNYHFDAFETYLGWDASCRRLVASVASCRNLYEGHVTANREAQLTQERAQDMLQDMSRLLLRLHEDHEGDSIALMKPLAEKLAALPPDGGQAAAAFRPPAALTRPRRSARAQRSSTLHGEVITVQGAVEKPPVTARRADPRIPPDLRDVKVSAQLRNDGPEILRHASTPKRKPTDMAPIPSFLQEEDPVQANTVRRRRRPRTEEVEREDEPVAEASVSREVHAPVPSPAPRKTTRTVAKRRAGGRREEDPYAFVPMAGKEDFRRVAQWQYSRQADEEAPAEPLRIPRSHRPRVQVSEDLPVRVRRSRAPRPVPPPPATREPRRKPAVLTPRMYLRWAGVLLLAAGLVAGLLWLDRWITAWIG